MHECLSPSSSPLRHRPSGSSPQIPCNLNSNSYSSSRHLFMLQSNHTRCFLLHSSPPFALLRRWRLLEIKVEKNASTADRITRNCRSALQQSNTRPTDTQNAISVSSHPPHLLRQASQRQLSMTKTGQQSCSIRLAGRTASLL